MSGAWWFNPFFDDTLEAPSPNNDHSQPSVTHSNKAIDPIPVAQEAEGDKNGGHADIPGHLKHHQDRGKARPYSELQLVFAFKHEDNLSTDIPRTLQLVCAYRTGLQTLRQQLHVTSAHSQSHISMETVPSIFYDDDATDADYIECGMASEDFQKWMNTAKTDKEAASVNGWLTIYEQFIGECRQEEEILAKTVQHLRHNPGEDNTYFCRDNLIACTNNMIGIWTKMCAVDKQLQSEMETLARSANPSLESFTATEIDPWNWVESSSNKSSIPDNWRNIHNMSSNVVRQKKAEVDCKCEKLWSAIQNKITEMDDQRKKNYVKLKSRAIRLSAIKKTLSKVLANISSGEHDLDIGFTEEEIWYNKFNLSYIDLHRQDAEVKVQLETIWASKTHAERPRLSQSVIEEVASLHQQYGGLVRKLRTRRESMRLDTKTHVSELEGRVVQLQSQMTEMVKDFRCREMDWYEKDLKTQQSNADLTTKLEIAISNTDHSKSRIDSEWKQYFIRMQTEYKNQFEKQQATLDEERSRMAAMRVEKENLLTRLSKIAGSKLIHGNPAITDLSDPNRPTKISEKYSELYDNEWTDAMEELSAIDGIVQGEDVVYTKILRALLIEAFTFCCETEATYVKTIRHSLTSLPGSIPDRTEQEQEETGDSSLTQEQTQQLDDLTKSCVPMLATAVESKFLTLMEKKFEHVISLSGGLVKSIDQISHSQQAQTGDKTTFQDNTDGDQPSTLDESNSTLNCAPGMSGQSPDEQATSQAASTTTLFPEPNGHSSTKNHRQFSHGHSDEMPYQDKHNEDTCGSHTADTTDPIRFSSLEKTNKFTKVCVNLCWLMRIQNPPLHMDTELAENSDINTDFYKNYTQKGRKVGYLVWPALFLHKGGPLLCKGIVQPLSNKNG